MTDLLSPESAGRWLRLAILVGWATGLVLLLLSVGYAVRVSHGRPGVVLLALTGATCGWLLVVVRQLPGWRSRR